MRPTASERPGSRHLLAAATRSPFYKPSGAKQIDAARAMGNFTNWLFAAVTPSLPKSQTFSSGSTASTATIRRRQRRPPAPRPLGRRQRAHDGTGAEVCHDGSPRADRFRSHVSNEGLRVWSVTRLKPFRLRVIHPERDPSSSARDRRWIRFRIAFIQTLKISNRATGASQYRAA